MHACALAFSHPKPYAHLLPNMAIITMQEQGGSGSEQQDNRQPRSRGCLLHRSHSHSPAAVHAPVGGHRAVTVLAVGHVMWALVQFPSQVRLAEIRLLLSICWVAPAAIHMLLCIPYSQLRSFASCV